MVAEPSDKLNESTGPAILVDGSSYLFRAFHALPPLATSSGQPTGAIKGVIGMLRKLMAEYPDGIVIVVFDARGRTFRDDLYADYKGTRPPMPDELRSQIEPTHEIIRAMGLPLLIESGVEADDVIGTLAQAYTEARREVLISSSDKDLAQLVNEHVTLVNTMSDTHLNPDGVEEKFGVRPERIIDLLTLTGDKVDNIPGIDGVGPKTAAKWLNQHGDLDGVIAAADSIKGKAGERLRAGLEQLPLSRELVTIRTDVPLADDPHTLAYGEPALDALEAWYTRLEFKGWLKEVQQGAIAATEAEAGAPATAGRDHYVTIDTLDALDDLLARARAAGRLCFDLETTSLDYMQACIVGWALAVAPGEGAYVPVAHTYPDAPEQLDAETVQTRIAAVLTDPKVVKIAQNIKYDSSVLARVGVEVCGPCFDTMLESYILDATGTRHNMDALALKYLGRTTTSFEDVAGKGARQIGFEEVRIDTATAYAAEDAEVTLALHDVLWPRLEAEPGLRSVFEEIDMPLVPVLGRIERRGTLVDARRLAQQSAELADRIAELEQQAHSLAGRRFNLGSPKQLQEILFGELKLPVLRKTPKGAPSTAEDVLQELAHDFPLPDRIIQWRQLSKLKSTYTDTLPQEINPETGRIHTSYHQAVAATGRLSSSDPNLQNIPIRTEEGRRIRQAFVAPAGKVLLAADYSQIELRIMAHLSGDTRLQSAFSEGLDVHRATAAEVFGSDIDAVSAEQRRSAKAVNFGLIYGMSAFGLARQLGIERGEAQTYIDLYFDRYPGVKRYMDEIRATAREQGYVETLYGRRLYLPEIGVSNQQRRQAAERLAINAPMQGTAADIIKRAMLAVDGWLSESGVDAAMIMQVHDELVFEVAESALADVRARVCELMEGAATLDVPLLVESGHGENWDEAH